MTEQSIPPPCNDSHEVLRIQWTCPHCALRHTWYWENQEEVMDCDCLICDRCEAEVPPTAAKNLRALPGTWVSGA